MSTDHGASIPAQYREAARDALEGISNLDDPELREAVLACRMWAVANNAAIKAADTIGRNMLNRGLMPRPAPSIDLAQWMPRT